MFGRYPRRLIIAAGVMLALGGPVSAATIIGVEALQTWNMIVFGDVRSNSSVAGRSFVGGNLTSDSAGFFVGSGGKADGDVKTGDINEAEVKDAEARKAMEERDGGKDSSAKDGVQGLTVAGNVGGRDVRLANASGASIGGEVDAILRFEGRQRIDVGGESGRQDVGDTGSEVRANLGKDFTQALVEQGDALRESMTSLSASLAALKPTGEIDGRESLSIKGGEGLNVYRLSLDSFREAKDISVTAADGSTIVINVSGSGGGIAARFLDTAANLGRNVIWNFYDASDLVFDSAFLGTVLAPGALVTTKDYLEGTLVAAGLEQGGELRTANFQGDLSTPHSGGGSGGVASVSLTPEPESWAMLILGFGLVGMVLRRVPRRRAVSAA